MGNFFKKKSVQNKDLENVLFRLEFLDFATAYFKAFREIS